MKVLFITWGSIGEKDIENAFVAEGHELIFFPATIVGDLDERSGGRLRSALKKEVPDVVFSIDFFPIISNTCKGEAIRYISWIFSAPYAKLYSQTVLNPCNLVYVFDKELCMELRNAGIDTVSYLPLAANVERMDAIAVSLEASNMCYDVSFVGNLYLEEDGQFERMFAGLTDFAKGYLDAVIKAQLKIQGYNFVEDVLGPVIKDLYQALPLDPDPLGLESQEYLYAQQIINRRITTLERIDLLSAIARTYRVDLFTYLKDLGLPNICDHGKVEYLQGLPPVLQRTKINLNISRRGLKSGIPLHVFTIMGSGGFLMSNFQAELLDFFVPGEDFVYYEDKEDMLQKIGYYLSHEEERKVIARSGHDKVAASHTYRHRIREIFS